MLFRSQQADAEAFIRQAIETMAPDDQAAVILFGANALVERPMSGLAELAPITSVPQALHTDIAEAIRLGMALFPAGSGRRFVILSDGAATVGNTLAAARLAAAAGVEIDYVPIQNSAGVVEAWAEIGLAASPGCPAAAGGVSSCPPTPFLKAKRPLPKSPISWEILQIGRAHV